MLVTDPWHAAETTTTTTGGTGTFVDLATYGLAGLLFVAIIVPLAVYIAREKDKQIAYRDGEIDRQREELANLRRTLELFPPAIQEMTRMVSTAIQVIQGGHPK